MSYLVILFGKSLGRSFTFSVVTATKDNDKGGKMGQFLLSLSAFWRLSAKPSGAADVPAAAAWHLDDCCTSFTCIWDSSESCLFGVTRPNAFRDMVHGWMRSSRQYRISIETKGNMGNHGKSQLDEKLQSLWCAWIMHGFLIWSSCHRKQSSITNAMAMPMHKIFVFAVQLRAGSGAAQQPTKSIQEHKSLKPCNSAECSWAGPSPEAVRHDRARNSALAARCLHRPSPRIEKWIKKHRELPDLPGPDRKGQTTSARFCKECYAFCLSLNVTRKWHD